MPGSKCGKYWHLIILNQIGENTTTGGVQLTLSYSHVLPLEAVQQPPYETLNFPLI